MEKRGIPRFQPSLSLWIPSTHDPHRFPYAAAVTIHRRREAGSVARAMECQNRVGNPYRYWGQHLHTWPASYLVIAAVISACPLSRLFYDKGCTPPPRMKLRRSIACVCTLLPPPPPPFHRHLFPRGWITTNRKVRRSEQTEQRFYPWRTLRDKTPYCSSYRSVTPKDEIWKKRKKKKKSRS